MAEMMPVYAFPYGVLRGTVLTSAVKTMRSPVSTGMLFWVVTTTSLSRRPRSYSVFYDLERIMFHLHLLSRVIQSDQHARGTRRLDRSLERLPLAMTEPSYLHLIDDLNTIPFTGELIPFIVD